MKTNIIMLKYFFYFLLYAFFIFISCSKTNNVTEKNDTNSVKEKPIIENNNNSTFNDPKEPDSINNKNTIAFLRKYGELNKENKILLKTRLGDITLKLYDDTPLHRASFIFLTKVGYFDTTCFYRVVPNFVIQGGESERLDTQNFKAKYMRYKLPSEFRKNRKHKYGSLALARDWKNNPLKRSTAFEFYIVQNRKGAHHLDGEHTVFGEVTSGFEVIDKIVNLKAGSDEWPLEDVFIKAIVIK